MMVKLTDLGTETDANRERCDPIDDAPDGYEAIGYTIDPTESKDPEYGRKVEMASNEITIHTTGSDAVLLECQRCGHRQTESGVAGTRRSVNDKALCSECGVAGGTWHADHRIVAVKLGEDDSEDAEDESAEIVTDGGVDVDETDADHNGHDDGHPLSGDELRSALEALADMGRVPVTDIGHRDDPRLHIKTPVGTIREARRPERVIKEGSSRRRQWTWDEYRLEEERDGHPDLDPEDRYAIVVKRVGAGR